jgi:hypothetical protein
VGRAQVAADGRLGADLEVAHVGRGAGQRLVELLEHADGSRGADGHDAVLPGNPVQPAAGQHQHAPRAEAAVGDVGDDDRPAGDDGHVSAVTEGPGRFLG